MAPMTPGNRPAERAPKPALIVSRRAVLVSRSLSASRSSKGGQHGVQGLQRALQDPVQGRQGDVPDHALVDDGAAGEIPERHGELRFEVAHARRPDLPPVLAAAGGGLLTVVQQRGQIVKVRSVHAEETAEVFGVGAQNGFVQELFPCQRLGALRARPPLSIGNGNGNAHAPSQSRMLS